MKGRRLRLTLYERRYVSLDGGHNAAALALT
jgi:hypothetical protein